MAEFCNDSFGNRARIAHALSKALFATDSRSAEGMEILDLAQTLRKEIEQGDYDHEDQSNDAYEQLVKFSYRL